jgi:hypothetical protein
MRWITQRCSGDERSGLQTRVARSGVPPTSDAIGGGVDVGEALA